MLERHPLVGRVLIDEHDLEVAFAHEEETERLPEGPQRREIAARRG